MRFRKQLHLDSCRQVQNMQQSVVSFREINSEARRSQASRRGTNIRMLGEWHVIAKFGPRFVFIAPDCRRVFAMSNHHDRRVREHFFEHLRVIDKHVAG